MLQMSSALKVNFPSNKFLKSSYVSELRWVKWVMGRTNVTHLHLWAEQKLMNLTSWGINIQNVQKL